MTYPTTPPFPPAYMPPPAPPKSKRDVRSIVIASVAALAVGTGIGYAAGQSNENKPTAASAGTHAQSTSDSAEPTEPIFNAQPAPTHTPVPRLRAREFIVKIKIRAQECFGSAGCNVTFQINPKYYGIEDLSHGSWDITYVVRGGDSGPQINTFTIKNGRASFDREEFISTPPNATLSAKALHVEHH
jgi:hypothetical protein